MLINFILCTKQKKKGQFNSMELRSFSSFRDFSNRFKVLIYIFTIPCGIEFERYFHQELYTTLMCFL